MHQILDIYIYLRVSCVYIIDFMLILAFVLHNSLCNNATQGSTVLDRLHTSTALEYTYGM